MNKLRKLISYFIPPIIFLAMQRIKGGQILFKGNYVNWDEATEKSLGYDEKHILEKVLAATIQVKEGKVAFERDSVVFDKIEYSWPVLTALMLAAANNGGRLSVLDFGGALGSVYFQNLRLLLDLPNLNWNVIEQSHYVTAGQQYIQDNHIKFYHSIEACLAENQPNVILLSGVLQYLQAPEELIKTLPSVGAKYLIIDRTPLTIHNSNHLVIQHVPASIYSASYPMWIFSRTKLDTLLAKNWSLISRNQALDGSFETDKKIALSFEGMLLKARK